MPTYEIYIRFGNLTNSIWTDNYLTAWTVYKMFKDMYPKDAIVDIVSCETGEVLTYVE